MRRTATICHCGEHAYVPLTNGRVAIIDPEFAQAVSLWRWHAHMDHGNWYARRSYHAYVGGRRRAFSVYLHRMILPVPDGVLVDHSDGDTLNNRLSNLRVATTSENAINRRKRLGSQSQYRGVRRSGQRWQAIITVSGRQQYLGVFDGEADAARAYDAAAIRMHGSFARRNFQEADAMLADRALHTEGK